MLLVNPPTRFINRQLYIIIVHEKPPDYFITPQPAQYHSIHISYPEKKPRAQGAEKNLWTVPVPRKEGEGIQEKGRGGYETDGKAYKQWFSDDCKLNTLLSISTLFSCFFINQSH